MIQEALKKVHQDIFERCIKKTIAPLPKYGNYSHEFDFKYWISNIPELKDFIIVTSKKIDYHNLSVTDFKRVYYVYDKDGNYLNADYIVSDYENFYKTLKEINEDIPR
jgi:hypothetical protein